MRITAFDRIFALWFFWCLLPVAAWGIYARLKSGNSFKTSVIEEWNEALSFARDINTF